MAGIMLGSAIAEGANGDWDTLFLVRQRDVAQSTATIGLAGFNLAMAIARLLGERWERRWGPYRLLAGGAAVAGLGMFAVVFAPSVFVDYVGFALAGSRPRVLLSRHHRPCRCRGQARRRPRW